MKVCPKCGGTKFAKRPGRSGERGGGRCVECKRRSGKQWYMRRVGVQIPGEVCCRRGCGRPATWQDPIPWCLWRACAEHKLPGDEPIAVDRKHARLPPP